MNQPVNPKLQRIFDNCIEQDVKYRPTIPSSVAYLDQAALELAVFIRSAPEAYDMQALNKAYATMIALKARLLRIELAAEKAQKAQLLKNVA